MSAAGVAAQPVLDWTQRYGSVENEFTNIAGICTDNKGNTYVTGTIESSTLTDIITLKYEPDGQLLWAKAYAQNIEDRAIDMKMDGNGNICVTGLTENNTGTYDIVTVKYDSNGDSLWVRKYDSQGTFVMDQPVAMFIDRNDNVIVAGYSFGGGPVFTHIILKYEPDGDSVWVRKVQPSGTPLPVDVTADLNGNVYLYSRGLTVAKFSSAGAFQWSRTYSAFTSSENNRSILTEESGNVYVAATKNTTTFGDYAILKLAPDGDTIWTAVRNGLGSSTLFHDDVYSLKLDVNGNVILGGESQAVSVFHFSTLKYSPAGILMWERNFSSPNSGAGVNDLFTDHLGNVYSAGGSGDIRIIKYSPSGDSLSGLIYSGPSNLNDYRPLITGDQAGNFYVAGLSREAGPPQYMKSVTMKYSQTSLDVKIIPQGFFNSQSSTLNSKDTLRIYLRENFSPYRIADSSAAILDSVTFNAVFRFSKVVSGIYYLTLGHRNSVETWSRAPGEFFLSGTINSYDFTTEASRAFGNNQTQISSKPLLFAIFGGDVNKDGVVDADDASLADNDAFSFVQGYVNTDVTGDGIVDANDAAAIDNNAFSFVGVIRP